MPGPQFNFYQPVKRIACIALAIVSTLPGRCQDSSSSIYRQWQGRYVETVNKKVGTFNDQVEQYTGKTLDRLTRQEQAMQRIMAGTDPAAANRLFSSSIDSLQKLKSLFQKSAGRYAGYFSYLDSLKQSLGFLKQIGAATASAGNMQSRLDASLQSADRMESSLAAVDKINAYLKQRQAVLQQQLAAFPQLAGKLTTMQKQAAIFHAQVEEYKNMVQDPEKIEAIALHTLEGSAAFQKYFQQHGQLSSLFASPGGFPATGAVPVVNGLPSRASLLQFVQGKMPAGTGPDPAAIISQKVTATNGNGGPAPNLDQLSKTLMGSGGNGNTALPGYSPDGQQLKPFRKRLEFGVNIQFGTSTNLLPARGNLGLQLGYKLSDRSTAGIGLAYTMGIGTDWNHIHFTNDALGFRSYLKWKPKKSTAFYLQGGAEWNYLTEFESISALRRFDAWQTSALLGGGRTYRLGKKLGGSITLLYDLLYDRHVPASQPLMMRIGYTF